MENGRSFAKRGFIASLIGLGGTAIASCMDRGSGSLPIPLSPAPLLKEDIAKLVREKERQKKKTTLRELILSIAPATKSSQQKEDDPAFTQQVETIMLINEMMNTTNPTVEAEIFSRCDTPSRREAVLPFVMNRPVRERALAAVWDDILDEISRQGLVLREDIKKLCASNQVRQGGISIFIMHASLSAIQELRSANSVYQTLEPHQTPSPLILAGIAQIETEGGKNFGSIPLDRVVSKRVLDNDYIPHLTDMMPQGVSLPLWPNAIFASTGGAIGIPQVVGNTLKNIKERRDGSKLNVFDMMEGTLSTAYILAAKDWDNRDRQKCRNAFGAYGAWGYVNQFDPLWEAAQANAHLLNGTLFVKG